MVVEQDDGCCIDEESIPENGPAVDGGFFECSLREHLLSDDGCFPVKEHSPDLLMVERLHLIVKKMLRCFGIGDVCYLHDLIVGIVDSRSSGFRTHEQLGVVIYQVKDFLMVLGVRVTWTEALKDLPVIE